jgi:NitT/TauT family transport system permease protein
VFVVVATTFPFIAVLLREGLQATSASLDEMRTVYRIKGLEAFRHVFVPQVAPYALMALRNEYSHAWKVVVLAELFIINSGMGWQFSQAFDRFQLITVMHWLLLFVAILLATEYLIIRPVEQRATRWKGKS